MPNPKPGRRTAKWERDPSILDRMADVQKLSFQGLSNVKIAKRLGIDESTVREDLKRLVTLWTNRIGEDAERLRGEAAAQFDQVRAAALAEAERHKALEMAVLFGQPLIDPETGAPAARLDPVTGEPITTPDGGLMLLSVYRDDKDRAEFRGQTAQHLAVANTAIMNKAKVLGLIIDKQEHTGAVPVRPIVIERDPNDNRDQVETAQPATD